MSRGRLALFAWMMMPSEAAHAETSEYFQASVVFRRVLGLPDNASWPRVYKALRADRRDEDEISEAWERAMEAAHSERL